MSRPVIALLLALLTALAAGSLEQPPRHGRHESFVRAAGCEELQRLAVRFAPIFYFDGKEEYFPSDAATFWTHTEIVDDYGVRLSTREPLPDPATKLEFFRGIDPSQANVTAYCVVVPRSDTELDLVYLHFYPYNFGKRLPVLGTECSNHVGDWEIAMVRLEATGLGQFRVAKVGGSVHGHGFTWAPYEVEFEGERPKLYLLRGGHGVSNFAGVSQNVNPWLRSIGLEEHHWGDGAKWDTSRALAVRVLGQTGYCPDVGDFSWWGFQGRWGNHERKCGLFGGCFGARCRLEHGPLPPARNGKAQACGLWVPYNGAWCPSF